jgi:hypothetical protein
VESVSLSLRGEFLRAGRGIGTSETGYGPEGSKIEANRTRGRQPPKRTFLAEIVRKTARSTLSASHFGGPPARLSHRLSQPDKVWRTRHAVR